MIELTSAPLEEEVERVPVCKLDGEEITMPAKPKAGVVLRHLRKLSNGAWSIDDEMKFLGDVLGSDVLDKLLDSEMSIEQYKELSNFVAETALGRRNEESNPGNLRVAS